MERVGVLPERVNSLLLLPPEKRAWGIAVDDFLSIVKFADSCLKTQTLAFYSASIDILFFIKAKKGIHHSVTRNV